MPEGGELCMVVLVDKSKPARYRCADSIVVYVQADTMNAFGKGPYEDMDATFACSSIADQNGQTKMKGHLVPGHHAAEALEKWFADQEARKNAVADPAKK